MSSSKLYDILKGIITKISTVNNNVNELNFSDVVDAPGVHIMSSQNLITLSLRGSGSIKLLTPYDYKVVKLCSDKLEEVTIDTTTGYLYLQDITDITEIDVHGQGINSFIVNTPCQLNKLVIYDNNITELDLSNCSRLQFLHMHNNPICDNDEYVDNLISCMRKLSNRNMTSTGSIILYPWYGLEILICKDSKGNYIKYPNGWSKLTLEDGRLYGVVNNNSITYHICEGGSLKVHTEMNRHHALRKELESTVCLKKNWVFGSAIMYSNDWQYCTWDFRYNNIADMWETAEKGFGLTWGGEDQFTNTLPSFNYMNVKDFRRCGTSKSTPENLPKALDYTSENDWKNFSNNPDNPYYKYLSGKRTHGDAILSLVFGTQWCDNNSGRRYGYIPNACAVLNDTMTMSGKSAIQLDAIHITMQYLANNSDTISLSYGLPYTHEKITEARNILGKYGEDHVLLVSSGNNGDGLPYTAEIMGNYNNFAGNYFTTDENGNTIEKQSNTIFVGSVGPDRCISKFSNNNVDMYAMGAHRDTYISSYGDQIFVWNNKLKLLKCGAGTSYSAPICSSVLLLLRIIYNKMFPQETSFGKHSNFMNHVRKRWCIHDDFVMDSAIGYGIPNILAEPYAPALLNTEPITIVEPEVALGNALNIEYVTNNIYSKGTFTPDNKFSHVAIDEDGSIYPLKPFSKLQLKLHSNSDAVVPPSTLQNYYTNIIGVKVTDNTLSDINGAVDLCESTLTTDYCNEPVIRTLQENNSEEFTVQFALDFSDKLYPQDIGTYSTNRNLLYFEDGDELGHFYINNISYTTGNNYITLNDNTMFHHAYYSDISTRSNNYIETQSVGFMLKNCVDFNITTYGIVTMTVSNKGITYYFNGTKIGHIVNIPRQKLHLSKVYVDKQTLCHDGIDCVRMYDRVLSNKEIIQNTIFMLNNHFDEVKE